MKEVEENHPGNVDTTFPFSPSVHPVNFGIHSGPRFTQKNKHLSRFFLMSKYTHLNIYIHHPITSDEDEDEAECHRKPGGC